MDILSIIGLLLATCALLVGAVLKGAGLASLLSDAAFMIVIVGTVAAICIQTPLQVMKDAARIFPWLFGRRQINARR
jgi:chemotaxis protein MotA